MAKNGLYTGIDIGTDTIKVLVAEFVNGEMNIIGYGSSKSDGLKNGIIVDIEKTATSVRRAVNDAEERAGITIDSLNVGLPANQLGIESCQGMIQFPGGSKEITDMDVSEVVSNTLMRSLVPEREIISLEPKEFTVDGFTGISDPRGMYGVRLEMKGFLYTGPKTLIHNIVRTIERAGLTVSNIVISAQALVEHVLNEGERKFGTIVIDMGAGQTTIVAVKDEQLQFAINRLEGGDYITNDISTVLNTSAQSAEDIKQNYGEASVENASQEEDFLVDVVGKTEPIPVTEFYLSQIIEARVAQIFEKIRQDLEINRALDYPGGLVILGGSAKMPGIIEMAGNVVGMNARLYIPTQVGLRTPAWATVISIVSFVSKRSDIENLVTHVIFGEYPQPETLNPTIPYQQETQLLEQEPSGLLPSNPQVYEEEADKDKENKDGVVSRIRGIFGNMFE